MKNQVSMFELGLVSDAAQLTNVASVPQRSPFRYPGGKTWLIPTVRKWLKQDNSVVPKLIEPFAGGAIVSLTAAFEGLANHTYMIEKDEEISAVWETILSENNKWLADKILTFNLTIDNAKHELEKPQKTLSEVAFCTILKNRIYHGGILAKGSGMVKKGENGKGITSRWYPKTLYNRIIAIGHLKDKFTFTKGNAFDTLDYYKNNEDTFFFIDPPYTVAGKRLYTHFDIDHEKLFATTSQIKGRFMLTYDDTDEIRKLSEKYNLKYKTIPMKTTHHHQKNEIIISDNFSWWE
jgi:DNA adenine methylase